ncbi:MAG: hypothetical protein ABIT08_15900 [Bacteroidia bacterium]
MKGSQYIAANTVALSAGGANMPAAFPAAYNLKMEVAKTKTDEFYNSIKASRVSTSVKVDAYA